MKTRSVDIAAYLYLAGLEPTVTWDPTIGVRVFEYPDTQLVKSARAAFNEDASVPVRTFVEARVKMKHTAVDKQSHG